MFCFCSASRIPVPPQAFGHMRPRAHPHPPHPTSSHTQTHTPPGCPISPVLSRGTRSSQTAPIPTDRVAWPILQSSIFMACWLGRYAHGPTHRHAQEHTHGHAHGHGHTSGTIPCWETDEWGGWVSGPGVCMGPAWGSVSCQHSGEGHCWCREVGEMRCGVET